MKLLILLCAFVSISVQASGFEKSSVCGENLQTKLQKRENRLGFANSGGLINGGVCWWHSRFQRNATYLTYFSPEKDIPKDEYVWKVVFNQNGKGTTRVKEPAPGSILDILRRIKRGNEMVEITGFSNLRDFSSYFNREIQDILNAWQVEDGFIYQQWITGLSGSHKVDPAELQKTMDDLYQRVKDGEIVYQRLQIEGITAHAWLVQGMEKTARGYKVYVVDSNFYSIERYEYRIGDESFYHYAYGEFTPYTENMGEEKRLERIRTKACK